MSGNAHEVRVTYRAREAQAGAATKSCMRLSPEAFLQRLLLHVPLPKARVVRYYGLYQPSHADVLAVCRPQLGQPPVVMPAGLEWQSVCARRGEVHPERCPTCGVGLVCPAVIPRGGAPPMLREADAA